jgi:hypothetical protein
MSEVKVNKLSPRSGTTVTLGDSGDTITIPSGVTFDASSGGLAGTLTTAAQPNITSVGTLTSFTSTGIDDNATSTAITIDSSQQVGIGATTPLHKLEVKDGEFAVRQTNSSASPGIKVINDVETQAYFRGAGTTRTNPGTAQGMPQLVAFSGYDLFISTDGNNNIPFTTNRSEKMRLTSDGKLGIGTSSPSASYGKLTVAGGITIADDNNAKLQIGRYSSGASNSYIKMGANSNSLRFTNPADTSDLMTITSTGYVGIGNTNPADFSGAGGQNLVVGSGSGAEGMTIYSGAASDGVLCFADGSSGADDYRGFLIYKHNDDAFQFGTSSTERMRLNSTGLGIGTSSPNGLMSIYGTGRLATFRNATTGTASTDGSYIALNGSDLQIANFESANIIFYTNDTERVRINNAGKIFTNQTAQFHNCVTIGGAVFTGDFQIEVSGLTAINGNSHRKWGMRLSYASIAGNATDSQQKDVLLTINGLTSYSGVSPIDTGGGTIAVSVDSATSTSVTFTVTTPGASTVGAYVATLFANDNSTMECNG